jgi:hypothetical protein
MALSADSSAFSESQSLSTVIIPKSVASIGSSAFFACTSLTYIHYNGSKSSFEVICNSENPMKRTPAKCVRCIDGDVQLM